MDLKKHAVMSLVMLHVSSLLFLIISCGAQTVLSSDKTDGTAGSLVANPSFEEGALHWENVQTDDNEYYSPVDGSFYTVRRGGEDAIFQNTDNIIKAGETYTVTVWTRSINPVGVVEPTPVEMRLSYRRKTIASVHKDVSPVRLKGAPQKFTNDDGGNVWLEDGYRMEFAEGVFYQLISADPLSDPWERLSDRDYDTDMAVGQIITPQGLKGVYSTYYLDSPPFYSEIRFISAGGSPPDYQWSVKDIVLSHRGSEFPWVIDAHLSLDAQTGKLWMTWGGGTVYVSEMDPTDGFLISHPADHEYDTHLPGTHTAVARWNGDEWTDGNDWFEGASLFQYQDYWYFFASYGHLAFNYTIRMGRGTSPTGPFFDKDGVGLLEFDSAEKEYGNSILLGSDGGQDCPGHPHFWEENGQYYMGFDYLDEYDGVRLDRFGIREIHWVNGWPTIWTPLSVTFRADNNPRAIGKTLKIFLENTGDPSTIAAFDMITVAVETEQE